jgi:Ca2+-binding RTX toxin-like protein
MSQAALTIRNLAIILAALTTEANASNLILLNDTTWHAGEMHDLTDVTVQIANGATLTIEKGSEVKNGHFEVFGALDAVGAPDALIYFRNVSFSMANNDPLAINEGRINIAYANIIGASSYIMPRNGVGYGSVTLTDSIISYTNYMPYLGLGYPIADTHIERNIFYLSGGISTATDNNVSVYIKNNAFAEQLTPAIENRDSSSGATVAENNSFLSTDRMALVLENGYGSDSNSAAISAANNYFATTDTALIDEMIYDRKDDLSVASFISTSHISEPSPDAPRLFVGTDGNDMLIGGGAGNGLLVGKEGTDTVVYGKASDQYKVNISSPYFRDNLINIYKIDHIAVSNTDGSGGVDLLDNVERLQFSDKSIAFDIDGNAGKAAKILGAVFGKDALADAVNVGIYLQLLDEGMSYEELMMLALNTKLGAGFSDSDEIRLLYRNIAGTEPSLADLNYWIKTIASGQYSQASFGVMEAELELNATRINLAGLVTTGLTYINATDDNTIVGTSGPDVLAGSDGNDVIDGLSCVDTVVYGNVHDQYVISLNASVAMVSDKTGNTNIDRLKNVERLQFSDQSLAFDIDGNAGKVAKVLGAVFGKDAVANVFYAGIGLQLLDEGKSYEELMMLALNAKLGVGFYIGDEVRLLYRNIVGRLPSQAEFDYWTKATASGQYTRASLGIMAAELELNANNINLARLAKTGLSFIDTTDTNAIVGTAGSDVLVGSDGNDVIDGFSGLDTVV